MDKIAVGPEAKGSIDIEAPVEHNIRSVAKAKGVQVQDVTVVILDRPRHEQTIRDIRSLGAKVRLIGDGDVAGAVAAAQDTNSIDIAMGIGGTPEGVITACAMKCMGGEIQGKLHPRDEEEISNAVNAGLDVNQVLGLDDLVASDNCYFVATGITNGDMLRGVAYRGKGAWTRSIVMRSRSGTIRRIEAEHSMEKLREFATIDFNQ